MAQNTDNIIFEENYVPIVMLEKHTHVNLALLKELEINIAILGRLSLDEKVYAIISLLDNLKEIKILTKKYILLVRESIRIKFIKTYIHI